jgi:hypothetical protein
MGCLDRHPPAAAAAWNRDTPPLMPGGGPCLSRSCGWGMAVQTLNFLISGRSVDLGDLGKGSPLQNAAKQKKSKLALGTFKNESGASDLPPRGRLSKYFSNLHFFIFRKKVVKIFICYQKKSYKRRADVTQMSSRCRPYHVLMSSK